MLFLDCEVYPNYFLVCAAGQDGSRACFELINDTSLDRRALLSKLETWIIVGFNLRNFDLPLLALAIKGAGNIELYNAGAALIKGTVRPRDVADVPDSWKHIDLKEVAPGVMVSLKLYGGRMHSVELRDLPYPPETLLSDDQMHEVRAYCFNDLAITRDLYHALREQIELRRSMSAQYGIDLMSKSDAQIAEAVLVTEIEARLGHKISAPKASAQSFTYRPPAWLRFDTPELRALFDEILSCKFTTNAAGVLQMPPELDGKTVAIGKSVYRLGIGGLHSSEKSTYWLADDNHRLIDIDATSYYPSIILEQGLYPPQCGPAFLEIYRGIVERRIKAKAAGDKVTADSLKIAVNGSFGKLGSPYSKLYAPDLFKQVTITGQLALLMLIEHLESVGIPVVSANTDGIVTRPRAADSEVLENVIAFWEAVTGYSTELTEYRGLYSRDVNSYFAIKLDGSVKAKGAFAHGGLSKNPAAPVVHQAVIEHIRTGRPIEEVIQHGQIRDYLTVRTVNGGGVWCGQYLGKVVRWYWSTNGEFIRYATNGNKVPNSDGARPVTHMITDHPADLDYGRYIKEAYDVLKSVGLDYGSLWKAA